MVLNLLSETQQGTIGTFERKRLGVVERNGQTENQKSVTGRIINLRHN